MTEREVASEVESNGLSDSGPPTIENRNAAIEELVRQHNDELVNYIYRWVRSRSDARDIAQEAYARIFRLGDKNVVSHLRGYLYKTAKNIASNWVRSRITRETFVAKQSLGTSEGDDRTPEQICLAREELEIVKSAFRQLSPRMRMAVHLIKEDGLSYDEVAVRLGIKPSSVRRLVERAMEFLLEAVSKERTASRGSRESLRARGK
jgi:RNA polymerase sigma factor (sigma-70 family)